MICPNCENKIPDKAKVCGYCGYRLKAGSPVQGTISQPVSSQRGMPVWAWGLIGGLVVITGIAVFTAAQSTRANLPAIVPSAIVLPTDIPTRIPSSTEAPPKNTPTFIPASSTPDNSFILWEFDQRDITDADFEESDTPKCLTYFTSGEFNITVKNKNWVCYDHTGFELSNSAIETKARSLEPDGYWQYGLLFGKKGDEYYVFRVDSMQRYGLLRRTITGDWEVLIGWITSKNINTGIDVNGTTSSNVLYVNFEGNNIGMYINGDFIGSYLNDSVISGSVGVIAGSGDADFVRTAFDYFLAKDYR